MALIKIWRCRETRWLLLPALLLTWPALMQAPGANGLKTDYYNGIHFDGLVLHRW